jgi:septal ring factor EnvC (AmiA/AmiB activator)
MVEKKDELEAQLKAEKEKMADSTEKLSELEGKYKKGKKEYENIEEQMTKAKSDFAVYERKQVTRYLKTTNTYVG